VNNCNIRIGDRNSESNSISYRNIESKSAVLSQHRIDAKEASPNLATCKLRAEVDFLFNNQLRRSFPWPDPAKSPHLSSGVSQHSVAHQALLKGHKDPDYCVFFSSRRIRQ
jgi:hypothetical protein